jgi:hypothetical protein
MTTCFLYTVHRSETTYSNGGNSGGQSDPGGIDLRWVRWIYLAEGERVEPGMWRMRSFAGSMEGVRASNTDEKVDLNQASQLSARARFSMSPQMSPQIRTGVRGTPVND